MGVSLLVVQHEDDCPPSWFGEWLTAAGVSLDVRQGHLGDAIPSDLSGHDGLMVLGGEMGAYDDATHPWLTATKALIAEAVAAGRPFLGICLGHQLACVELGGTVVKNPGGSTIGLTAVTPTADAAADPLLSVVAPGSLAIHWNSDVVAVLPPGATALAHAPDGTIQAARLAPRAWGVQFHPEAAPDIFTWWLSVVEPGETRTRAEAAARRIDAAEQALRRDWEPLARRFADLVAAGVAVP